MKIYIDSLKTWDEINKCTECGGYLTHHDSESVCEECNNAYMIPTARGTTNLETAWEQGYYKMLFDEDMNMYRKYRKFLNKGVEINFTGNFIEIKTILREKDVGLVEIKGTPSTSFEYFNKGIDIYNVCPICFKLSNTCKCVNRENFIYVMIISLTLANYDRYRSYHIPIKFMGELAEKLIGLETKELLQIEEPELNTYLEKKGPDILSRNYMIKGEVSQTGYCMDDYQIAVYNYKTK
ncbi:MAG: hypothetical protein ACFE9S_16195 [Candidatus Hermodarchaeota archaeon]